MYGVVIVVSQMCKIGTLALSLLNPIRMQISQPRQHLFSPFLTFTSVLLLAATVRLYGVTFTVTNTSDSGAGSLRWAINSANGTSEADVISFNIPGSGVQTIQPLSELPNITNPLSIDGYTQPGASVNTGATGSMASILIRLDGSFAGNNSVGLKVDSTGCTIRGLAIVNFGTSSSAHGIHLHGKDSAIIEGNFIGMEVDGTTVAGNGGLGIFVESPDNIIGGTSPAQRNVISGNKSGGIYIKNTTGNQVSGNFIGTDALGVLARGNEGPGIQMGDSSATLNVIGGTNAGSGNVISGNGGSASLRQGILIERAVNNRVQGNFIGTDVTGQFAIPNADDGITINNDAEFNVIGGSQFGAGNLISGNGRNGISLTGRDSGHHVVQNVIQGNRIGVQSDGVTALANSASGIHINLGSQTTIGGTNQSEPNIIANNSGPGVWIEEGVDNATIGNAIFGNAGLGIDLGIPGVQANDSGDSDSGANNLQNFPVLSSVSLSNGNTLITGTLNSQGGQTYRIDFYSSAMSDPSGYGEGAVPLGSVLVTTTGGGAATINAALPGEISSGHSVAATATDMSGNSSEFSGSIQYSPAPPSILSNPTSQTPSVGSTVVLSVNASGNPAPTFQWRLNGMNIPGATNSSYSIPNFQATNGGSYTVVVRNDFGAVVSQPAVLIGGGLSTIGVTDLFGLRPIILPLPIPALANNIGATLELNEPLHSGILGGHSVWFAWMAPSTGVATFSTLGSTFDTVLAVYSGNSLLSLTELASDEDSAGYHCSKVSFNVVGGATYAIVVDGAHGALGNIVVTWNVESTGDSMPRIVSRPIDGALDLGNSAFFSISASGANLKYQWYRNDAILPGFTNDTLSLPNVGISDVGRYKVRIASGLRVKYSQPVELQLNKMDGNSDPFVFARDKFGYAAEVKIVAKSEDGPIQHAGGGGPARGYTGTQVFSTYGGSTDAGEPAQCDNAGGASSWFSYQAESDGTLEINTDGSDFDTVLAVYTGSGESFESLEPVDCDDNSGSNGVTSKVVFEATEGTVYWIAVDGVNGAYGTVMLNYNLNAAPTVTLHPTSRSASSGSDVSLTAHAIGNPPPVCQWMFNGVNVSGATNTSLTLTNFVPEQAGFYSATFSNSMGGACSSLAELVLNAPTRMDSFSRDENGRFQMRLVCSPSTQFVILASTNMVNWVPVATNSTPNGLWNFVDTQSTNFPNRYYRAVTQ